MTQSANSVPIQLNIRATDEWAWWLDTFYELYIARNSEDPKEFSRTDLIVEALTALAKTEGFRVPMRRGRRENERRTDHDLHSVQTSPEHARPEFCRSLRWSTASSMVLPTMHAPRS